MRKQIPELTPRRILIRAANWIGDAVMTAPAVRTIRASFPEARITMLALPWVADVFAASPHVDDIYLYLRNTVHRSLTGKLRLARELAEEKFDMAILLQNAFEAAFIATAAGISVRAGYATDGRSPLLTHRVRVHPETRRRHQVHYYQEMVRGLGLTPGPDELFLTVDGDAMAVTSSMLRQKGVEPDEDILVGINPGAAYGPAKRWPQELFSELAGRILTAQAGKPCRILVFGTAADRDAAALIRTRQKPGERKIFDFAGKTSLMEAMALISRCRVFISNDSGLMHVAAALQVPTVAIFGSTNPETTGPFSPLAKVVEKDIPCRPCFRSHCRDDLRCMRDISVDDVLAPTLAILQEKET